MVALGVLDVGIGVQGADDGLERLISWDLDAIDMREIGEITGPDRGASSAPASPNGGTGCGVRLRKRGGPMSCRCLRESAGERLPAALERGGRATARVVAPGVKYGARSAKPVALVDPIEGVRTIARPDRKTLPRSRQFLRTNVQCRCAVARVLHEDRMGSMGRSDESEHERDGDRERAPLPRCPGDLSASPYSRIGGRVARSCSAAARGSDR